MAAIKDKNALGVTKEEKDIVSQLAAGETVKLVMQNQKHDNIRGFENKLNAIRYKWQAKNIPHLVYIFCKNNFI